MKVGITIKDWLKDYLEQIAEKNHVSVTKVCSLICENFLSYNLHRKVIPVFQKYVKINFQKSECDSGVLDQSSFYPSEVESSEELNWDEMLAELDSYVPEDGK